jgi:hypothetical protein
VLSASFEYLDLAVKSIPRVKPPAAVAPPPMLTIWRSERLETIQDRRSRDRFAQHDPKVAISA